MWPICFDCSRLSIRQNVQKLLSPAVSIVTELTSRSPKAFIAVALPGHSAAHASRTVPMTIALAWLAVCPVHEETIPTFVTTTAGERTWRLSTQRVATNECEPSRNTHCKCFKTEKKFVDSTQLSCQPFTFFIHSFATIIIAEHLLLRSLTSTSTTNHVCHS